MRFSTLNQIIAPGGRLRLILGGLCIFGLVLMVYRPLLPGSFLMDDQRLIERDNPLVNGELRPSSVWFRTDFPLSTLAFWVQWLAWGKNPGWYHAVNMALHALSAALAWRLLARLKVPGAWVAGAIFAVHPVCVASVGRIAELKNTLSLPFFLLSICFYLHYEALSPDLADPDQSNSRWRVRQTALWYGLSVAAFVLALLSKTSTVMLPLVLLACAAWRRGRITRQDLLQTAPFFILALAFGLMSIWFQKHQALAGQTLQLQPASFWEHLAISGRVFWFYLGKALLPLKLNLFYPQWKVVTTSPASYLPVLLICAGFILCWRFRGGWGRHALLGLGVFAVTLFPALGFFDAQFLVRWQVSDHLQYLPLIAPVALAAAALASRSPAKAFASIAVAVVLALSVLAFKRAQVFASEESLFRDTIARNPDAWVVQNYLGVLLANRKDYSEAAAHFVAALHSKPDNPEAEANLGQTLAAQGKFAEAEPHFVASLKIDPNDLEAHKKFAAALRRQGRNQEALHHLQMAARLKPELRTEMDCVALLYQSGDFQQAAAHLRRALLLDPDSVEALNNLAWLLATCSDEKARDGAEAVRCAERAARLPPVKEMCVLGTLAAAYAEAKRFPEAIATAEKAVQLETAAGETRFAALNRQLLTFYRAGKPFHEPGGRSATPP